MYEIYSNDTISCLQSSNWSYVGQTSRHLQQCLREYIGSQRLLEEHFDDYNLSPSINMVTIFGKNKFDRLLIFEALFILELNPALNE